MDPYARMAQAGLAVTENCETGTVSRCGERLLLASGVTPNAAHLPEWRGPVQTVDQAREAARQTALMLAQTLHTQLGSLFGVRRVCRAQLFVCTSDRACLAAAREALRDTLLSVWEDPTVACSAMGVTALTEDAPMALDAVVELEDVFDL